MVSLEKGTILMSPTGDRAYEIRDVTNTYITVHSIKGPYAAGVGYLGDPVVVTKFKLITKMKRHKYKRLTKKMYEVLYG